MKIVIKGSTLVCPCEQTPSRRLWLSTIDVMYTDRGYVALLFFYKFDGSPNFFDPLVLKESLSKVLVPFYPVAGRLTRDGNSRIEIDCNGQGVLYAEAVSDSPMSDIGGFNSGLELVKVFPPINRSLHDLYSSPLFAVQVTRFSCGGVSLGIGCHHNLSDGTGFLNFITSWSELARGLSTSMPPLLDRDILRARVPPTPVFYHHEFDKPPVMITSFTQNSEESSSSKADSSIVLEITSDHMKTLVSMIGDERTKIKYTRYEILSAFLWRVACKARNLPDTQATKMRIPINGRPRLNPPIPPNYFGNALFICTTTALCGELVSEPFAHSVDRIHEAIRRMDDKYLRSALDFLDKTDELTTIMQGPQNTACPNFSIVSWKSFPFHGVNFGWGQPYMRPASIFAGKGYVLASPTDKEGLMLAICLEAEHIQAFLELFHASFQVRANSYNKKRFNVLLSLLLEVTALLSLVFFFDQQSFVILPFLLQL
ncbi:hypothetical protein K2173_016240 [Erythroxylum novogranatense]|uniref:Uncharacterized protein n=1 Tax=Erythroxylum novogranatense TaxID=1862640 RepID=A0AAV8SFY5_9ROSI|nr:hypothetical protein K2173_016240 [Erythroxylum novogranatense]